jgi:hypothetical protein
MSDNDDYVLPDPEVSRAYFEEMGARAGRAAERSEHDPWILEYRRVAAEVKRTGNQSLFADYQRRFLASLALLYPPETHTRW